jgi:hypothetical protein
LESRQSIEAGDVKTVKPTGLPEGSNPRGATAERFGPQVGFVAKVRDRVQKIKGVP